MSTLPGIYDFLQFPLDFFPIVYIIILMNSMEGRVWAEIYLDRLIHNYHIIRKAAKNTQIMAAIKADAYGHGAVEVAKTLEAQGVEMFGVASVEEGIELREAGVTSKILILSPILHNQIDTVIEYRLMPTIADLHFFKKLNEKLIRLKRPMTVHIEIDTGMTRTGLPYKEAEEALNIIRKSPLIRIEGIFSHFPTADADGAFSRKQIKDFTNLINNLSQSGLKPGFYHLSNSAGIFKYANAHFNLVRPGISLYGLRSSPEVKFSEGFRPVMALKSRIVNLREVPANTPISYGHLYRTKKRSMIATLSVGYGDGYPRMLSNTGEVLCHGKKAKIVGAICMDLMMVDVTKIPDIRISDVITLIGQEGCEEILAEECAAKCRTIVYELTSGIGPRVARLYKYRSRVVSIRNLLGRWRNQ